MLSVVNKNREDLESPQTTSRSRTWMFGQWMIASCDRGHRNCCPPRETCYRIMQFETIQQYLDAAERNDSVADSALSLPWGRSKSEDMFIANLEFADCTKWMICRRSFSKHHYLATGSTGESTHCILFGCPETICRDCVLDQDTVLAFATLLPDIDNLPFPLRWVTFDEMYPDVQGR